MVRLSLCSERGTARAEDAQGTPTQSHISPSILVYEDSTVSAVPTRVRVPEPQLAVGVVAPTLEARVVLHEQEESSVKWSRPPKLTQAHNLCAAKHPVDRRVPRTTADWTGIRLVSDHSPKSREPPEYHLRLKRS